MAYPQSPTGQGGVRIPVQDRYWVKGCNTLLSPTDLTGGFYYWSENCLNRGGIMQTRPGRHLLFALPGRRAQGLCIYRPYRQKEQLVWAIDGNVFFSVYPFTSYVQIPNVSFYKHSPRVYFCQARQAVKQNLDGSLTVLPTPVDMLILQDGYTASAFYIATSSTAPQQSGHNQAGAPTFQCPTGQMMVYSGSRLWLAYNETIFASDLLNPNSFTERTYLAEMDGFKLPEPCTGMLETPSANPSQLNAVLCFSPFTITSLQSGVLDRTQWQNTTGFQYLVSKDYGSVAAFGPTFQFGEPWFFSEVGLVSMDMALQQYRSSQVTPQDGEMIRSKMNMSPLRSGICGISYENFLLYAVPSGNRWNKHIWVMDGAIQAQLQPANVGPAGNPPPAWVGIWTGTYPVQFATGEIQDVPRLFELSYSLHPQLQPDGENYSIMLWEDFMGRRVDYNETPIACSFETKIFEVSQVGELIRFKYAEIDVVELIGDCTIQIYYGGIKGHYRLAYELLLSAEEGVPGNANFPLWTYQSTPTGAETGTFIQTYKTQTRTIRTPDFVGAKAENDNCADTCGIESPYVHNVDKGFQLLINWQGRMGIREVRMFVDQYPQPGVGSCTPSEEGETNIVTAIGCLPPPKVCTMPAKLAGANTACPPVTPVTAT